MSFREMGSYNSIRQQAYLRAFQAYIPEISIILGHFLTHTISMPLANPTGTER